jgi:hypothetical protein
MKTKMVYLTTKITVAVVLVVVLAVKAFAGSAPKVSLVPYANERAVITVENLSNLTSELAIEDANGYMVYFHESKIASENYSKKFDFKNLRNGSYKVIATNGYGKMALSFNVENGKVIVDAENESENVPVVLVKDDMLKVSYLNHSLKDVKIKLLSEYGEFYSKELGNDFTITTGFNLNRLERGEYAVVIENGKKSYSFTFEK